jgi:hypothetical protein
MEIWRRFWRLSGFERVVVLEAAAGITITCLGLRLAGFRRWKAIAERFARAAAQKPRADGSGSGAQSAISLELPRTVAGALVVAATARHRSGHEDWREESSEPV